MVVVLVMYRPVMNAGTCDKVSRYTIAFPCRDHESATRSQALTSLMAICLFYRLGLRVYTVMDQISSSIYARSHRVMLARRRESFSPGLCFTAPASG